MYNTAYYLFKIFNLNLT